MIHPMATVPLLWLSLLVLALPFSPCLPQHLKPPSPPLQASINALTNAYDNSINSTFGITYSDPSGVACSIVDIREQVRNDEISFAGPATGQVVLEHIKPKTSLNILILVKRDDPSLTPLLLSLLDKLTSRSFFSSPTERPPTTGSSPPSSFVPTLFFEPDLFKSLKHDHTLPHLTSPHIAKFAPPHPPPFKLQ